MTTTIVVVVIVLLLLAAAAWFTTQKLKRERLHTRFGPEYERQVEQSDSRAEAERRLQEIAKKRDQLEIRDLDDGQRAAFSEQWQVIQARFVDEPAAAVDGAESLVDDVLRTRGYPADDFDNQAGLVAADHPDVVQHYRSAHEAHERHRATGQADTEDLRQAFVHYRSLFDSLVGRDGRDAVPDRATGRSADLDGDGDVDLRERLARHRDDDERDVDLRDHPGAHPAPTERYPERS